MTSGSPTSRFPTAGGSNETVSDAMDHAGTTRHSSQRYPQLQENRTGSESGEYRKELTNMNLESIEPTLWTDPLLDGSQSWRELHFQKATLTFLPQWKLPDSERSNNPPRPVITPQ